MISWLIHWLSVYWLIHWCSISWFIDALSVDSLVICRLILWCSVNWFIGVLSIEGLSTDSLCIRHLTISMEIQFVLSWSSIIRSALNQVCCANLWLQLKIADTYNKEEEEQSLRGHPFMTSTKKSGFWPPPPVHMGRTPPCGRPHAVDMKYTPLSWNG